MSLNSNNTHLIIIFTTFLPPIFSIISEFCPTNTNTFDALQKRKKTTKKKTNDGRRRRRKRKRKSNDTNEDDKEDDKEDKEEKIYVWKRGIALEEKKVPRENQAKIDALYPKTTTKEKESSSLYYRRVDARDILRTYAKTREEEDALLLSKQPTSIASKLLLFATVFAYAVGFALTTHRGVVDLSPPAPIECEKSDAECTEETLPKRVEVFVSL